MNTDQILPYVADIRIGQTQFYGQITTQVVKQDVGVTQQPVQHLQSFRVFQIKLNAFLVTVEPLKKKAIPVLQKIGANRTTDITCIARILDLDDLRTHVGE